jgi:hypothetical protein
MGFQAGLGMNDEGHLQEFIASASINTGGELGACPPFGFGPSTPGGRYRRRLAWESGVVLRERSD